MSFPAPGDDFLNEKLFDLNTLVRNQAATFMMRVSGSGLLDDHICPGDLLVVDRSEERIPGRFVVAAAEGEFWIRRLEKDNQTGQLILATPEGERSLPEFEVWGVVTTIIRSLC